MRELSINLANIGNHITILARLSSDTCIFTHPNIIVRKVFSINKPWWNTISYSAISFVYGFFLLLVSEYDVIYERHHFFGTGCLLGSIFSLPKIVEIDGLLSEEHQFSGIIDERVGKILLFFERINYKMADALISVTPEIKEVLVEKYGVPFQKITVISNAVNTKLFRPMNKVIVKKKLGLSEEENYVCFVGQLAVWQGLENLILSSINVLKELPSTRFLIIGDGPLRDKLTNLTRRVGTSKGFIFTGTVTYENVPLYINASEVCILPKKPMRSGYSPLKLYEYMACGKPVIATNISSFELLEKYGCGLIVNTEDYDEFAKCILKVLRSKKEKKLMGQKGRKYVIKNHTWISVARRTMKLFRVLICHSNTLDSIK